MPGFVKVIGPSELAFPDYDGNGMFKSLGNIVANPNVGLLFIDMGEKPRRVRVNGEASVSRDDPLMQRFCRCAAPGARESPGDLSQLSALHRDARNGGGFKYAPRPDYAPPEPAWKGFDDFKDYIHPRQKTPNGT